MGAGRLMAEASSWGGKALRAAVEDSGDNMDERVKEWESGALDVAQRHWVVEDIAPVVVEACMLAAVVASVPYSAKTLVAHWEAY